MNASNFAWRTAALACTVLLAAACSEDGVDGVGSSIVGIGTPTATAHDVPAEDQVCRSVPFSGAHGSDITSFSADFGGSIGSLSFDVAATSTGGGTGVSAKAYSVQADGPDPDLEQPPTGYCSECAGLGIVMVIGDTDFNEGDIDAPGTITITTADVAEFIVTEFDALDQEADQGEGIRLLRDGGPLVTDFPASISDDGEVQEDVLNTQPETFGSSWVFEFRGSGAVDNLEVCVEEPEEPGGGQGCTPGYWRNLRVHLPAWEQAGYAPTDDFCTAFGLGSGLCDTSLRRPERGTLDDLTLYQAVTLRGGGINALTRHAVAALLNAGNPGISYDLTEGDVVSAYTAAIDGGDVEEQKDVFDELNNQGCPCDNQGCPIE